MSMNGTTTPQEHALFAARQQQVRKGGPLQLPPLPSTGVAEIDEQAAKYERMVAGALEVHKLANVNVQADIRQAAKRQDENAAAEALNSGKLDDFQPGAHLKAAEEQITEAQNMEPATRRVADEQLRALKDLLDVERDAIEDDLTAEVAALVKKIRPAVDKVNADLAALAELLQRREAIVRWPAKPPGIEVPSQIELGSYH